LQIVEGGEYMPRFTVTLTDEQAELLEIGEYDVVEGIIDDIVRQIKEQRR